MGHLQRCCLEEHFRANIGPRHILCTRVAWRAGNPSSASLYADLPEMGRRCDSFKTLCERAARNYRYISSRVPLCLLCQHLVILRFEPMRGLGVDLKLEYLLPSFDVWERDVKCFPESVLPCLRPLNFALSGKTYRCLTEGSTSHGTVVVAITKVPSPKEVGVWTEPVIWIRKIVLTARNFSRSDSLCTLVNSSIFSINMIAGFDLSASWNRSLTELCSDGRPRISAMRIDYLAIHIPHSFFFGLINQVCRFHVEECALCFRCDDSCKQRLSGSWRSV